MAQSIVLDITIQHPSYFLMPHLCACQLIGGLPVQQDGVERRRFGLKRLRSIRCANLRVMGEKNPMNY